MRNNSAQQEPTLGVEPSVADARQPMLTKQGPRRIVSQDRQSIAGPHLPPGLVHCPGAKAGDFAVLCRFLWPAPGVPNQACRPRLPAAQSFPHLAGLAHELAVALDLGLDEPRPARTPWRIIEGSNSAKTRSSGTAACRPGWCQAGRPVAGLADQWPRP